MKPREYFETASRIIGLVLTLYGTGYLADFVAVQIGYYTLQHTDVAFYLLMGIGYVVVGLYFLRGASHFVRFAYSEEPEKIESSEINSSHVKSSYNTNNQNNPNFEELISSSLDESNNQILLYALDTESGETKIVTIPL